MTGDDDERQERVPSAAGPDLVVHERLLRLRWLLEHPLRLRLTIALLLFSYQDASPRISQLADFLGESQGTVLEQLNLMRHQGAVSGSFWLDERLVDTGTVQLVPALSGTLPLITDALGPPPSTLPPAPQPVDHDKEDRHLRVPSGDDLIAHAYYLLRQRGELGKTTSMIVSLGRLLAHPLRIEILVQLIRLQGATTDELVSAIEEDHARAERLAKQQNLHRVSRPSPTASDIGNRVRELADHCAIVPVPHRSGQWNLSDPMRSVFTGIHEYLVAIRDLGDASLTAPPDLQLPGDPDLN